MRWDKHNPLLVIIKKKKKKKTTFKIERKRKRKWIKQSLKKNSLTVMNYRIHHPKNIQKIEGDLRMEGYQGQEQKKKKRYNNFLILYWKDSRLVNIH